MAFGIAGTRYWDVADWLIFRLSSLQGLLQGHIQQRSSQRQKPVRSVRRRELFIISG